jgi:fibronectin type 3 domain-containing protein
MNPSLNAVFSTRPHLVRPTAVLLLLALVALLSPVAATAAEVTLIPAGSVWRYLANGSNQGTIWRTPTAAFDDSSWPSGPAELGYGDGDEETVVPSGPDANTRYITTYFRHAFNVDNPEIFTALNLRVKRDDGVVVYLNGIEQWRNNMPSGSINYLTPASTSAPDENVFIPVTVAATNLARGRNVLAVEIHQVDTTSTDISFDLELVGSTTVSLVRGPYLQIGTPTSIRVRWRTVVPTNSRVRYGTAPGSLTLVADNATSTTEHDVLVSGLSPSTRYYYSVGSTTEAHGGGDADHYFVTSPPANSTTPTRIWVLGDSGTANNDAKAVRDAYLTKFSAKHTNLWLMLGDNAYEDGTDPEYQVAVFDMYPTMLRKSVLWPTIGNHDTAQASSGQSFPYLNIFTLPTGAEAGGVASGSEKYYSFDYGNIHFVCLDSMTSDRRPTGPMLTWLRNDLMATTKQWVIAFWHHPPYSKGSHDSDFEHELVEMRQYAVPILEDFGVDLVLAGHSHSYERSFLIDSHYGTSSSFVSSMKKDGGSGQPGGSGPYEKKTLGPGPHEGAVYVVAGSSGLIQPATFGHPAMYIGITSLGSLILDVNGGQLNATFIDHEGSAIDHFTIEKGNPPDTPLGLSATPLSATRIDLQWTDRSTIEDGFRIERCTGTNSQCNIVNPPFAQIGQVGANVVTYSDLTAAGGTTYTYRVRAFNNGGNSAYSNTAAATTPAAPAAPSAPTNLTASAASSTQVNLGWTDTSTNETSFRIERCAGAGCTSFAEIATAPAGATSYADTTVAAATTYVYRVRAANANGSSAPSNSAAATTPAACTAPAITTHPQSTTITSGSSATLTVSATGTAPLSYQWFAGTASITGATASSITVSPTATTTYYVRVTNSCGSSVNSNTATVTVNAPPPPAAPTGLTATATSSSQINLAWVDNSTNETSFRIERCAGAGCTSFAEIATAPAGATSYADTTVAAATTYVYRVRAANANGSSAPSNSATATTPAACAAPAITTHPQSTTITSGSSATLSVSATGTAPLSYQWFAGTAPITGATASSVTVSPTATTSYYVRVTNSCGSSVNSNTATVTVNAPPPPAAPTGLTATATSSSQINLAWVDNSTNETSFRIERCAGAGCTSFAEIATAPAGATSYADVTAVPATTYVYRVRAANANGSSAPSNSATATTLAACTAPAITTHPQSTTITSGSSATLSVSANGTAPLSYQWFVGTAPITGATQSSITVSPNSTTSYFVSVTNSCGTINSNTATVTVTAPPPPAAPSNLSATAVSSAQINLAWVDNSTNETSFRIERCAGAGCTALTQVAQVGANSTTYADASVAGGMTYSYRVVAANSNGASSSNVATASTPVACIAPSITAHPQSTAITAGGSATLSVGATGSGPLSYQWYTGEPGERAAPVNGGSNPSMTVSPTATTKYWALVWNACGSSNSAAATVTVTPCSYEVSPTSLSFPAAGGGGVITVKAASTCSWTASTNELWITLNSGSSGTGDGEVTYTISPNVEGQRTGSIVVAGITIPVVQQEQGTAPAPPVTPTGVNARATGQAQVTVSWVAVQDATVYEVRRRSAGGAFAVIGTSSSTSYSDNNVSAGSAYLYSVRALNSNGSSGDSSSDLATVILFTDDPLIAGATPVKAVHLSELRLAVNAVRQLAGLPSYPFSGGGAGTPIVASHIAELRTALDEASAILGRPSGSYTDTVGPGARIRAVHFQEIRNRVK